MPPVWSSDFPLRFLGAIAWPARSRANLITRAAGKLGSLRELERPRSLGSGGRVGVAAVSGPADADRLDRGIAFLRKKGYEVVEAANLRARSGFLAGTDAQRAGGYRALLADRSVDAIVFARGGYGASRVLPH